MSAAAPVRVLVADDHVVVRSGLRRLFENAGMQIVGEVATGDQAYLLYGELQPDILIMDLSMPGIGGLESLRRIVGRHPGARVLVFSMHETAAFAAQAMRAGARGYVAKSAVADELIAGVKAAMAGELYISPAVAQRIAVQWLSGAEHPAEKLTTREFEIFRMLAEGLEVDTIAERLSISQKTVANYQTLLKQKLGVNSAVELLRVAIRHGVVQ